MLVVDVCIGKALPYASSCCEGLSYIKWKLSRLKIKTFFINLRSVPYSKVKGKTLFIHWCLFIYVFDSRTLFASDFALGWLSISLQHMKPFFLRRKIYVKVKHNIKIILMLFSHLNPRKKTEILKRINFMNQSEFLVTFVTYQKNLQEKTFQEIFYASWNFYKNNKKSTFYFKKSKI